MFESCNGKLEELLFDTTPHGLVPLLLVPTESAQQPASRAASTELQISSSSFDATSPSAFVVGSSQQHAGNGAKNDPRNTFCTLPPEIYGLIFSYLNLVELACVSLTTPCLLGITQETVHLYLRSLLGTWAGEKIVCAGDEGTPGDYPPGLFSAEEEEDFKKTSLVLIYNSDGETDGTFDFAKDGEDGEPLNLYSLSERPGTRIDGDISFRRISQKVYDKCMERTLKVNGVYPGSWMAVLDKRHDICVDRSPFVPTDEAWILRNLTTKEFATSAGIALDANFIDGPFIEGIGFGEVVMSRTCWSSSASTSMSYKGQMHRGVWAGHRFDITTRRRHDESTKDEEGEWKDVTKEVASEIAAIWKSAYGQKWREIMMS